MKSHHVLGALFLTLFVADLLTFGQGPWQLIFWACNHVSLVLAIGFLWRSRFIFTSLASLLFIPQLFWIVDFFVRITGTRFLGVTDYLFEPGYPVVWFWLSLKHLFLPFVALYGVWRYGGAHKDGWKGALAYGVVLALIGLVFSPQWNINCIHRNCVTAIPLPPPAWWVVYPLLMLAFVWLQFKLVQKLTARS